MSKTKQEKRSKVKPFIKVINYNHLMPTRYTLELEGLKSVINADTFKEPSQREEAKKTVKKVLEERYTSGKNRWFFTPLRTSFFPTPRTRAPCVPRYGVMVLTLMTQVSDRVFLTIGWAGRMDSSGCIQHLPRNKNSEAY